MRNIKSLNNTIFFVKLKKIIDDWESKTHKQRKILRVKLVIFLIPVLTMVINLLTIKSLAIMLVSLIAVGSLGIGSEIVNMIKDLKNPNIEDDEIKFDQREGSDFYSPQYTKFLSEISEEELGVNLEVIDNSYLKKEEAISQVVKEIETYTLIYQLPPLKLSDESWDKFFDILYGIFVAKGIEDEYYENLSFFIRYVFSKVLLEDAEEITIDVFIDNIDILNQILTLDEINYIKEEFALDKKILDFRKLQKN